MMNYSLLLLFLLAIAAIVMHVGKVNQRRRVAAMIRRVTDY
jgi:hypothetical protein